MSSVIGGVVVGGATSSAPAGQSYYHCYNCDRVVTIIPPNQLLCPNCNGVVLEELEIPSPRRSGDGYDNFFLPRGTDGFDSESDSDLEFSRPPPPPPPPRCFTANNTHFSYPDSGLDFSYPLPPPPPLPNRSEQLASRPNYFAIPPPAPPTIHMGFDFDFNPPPPLPPPPPPPLPTIQEGFDLELSNPPPPPPRRRSNGSTVTLISGLEIDFSEQLDNYFWNRLPPPPPPPPLPSSNLWDFFLRDPEPIHGDTSTRMEVKKDEGMVVMDTKITEEILLGMELCTQCAVCIDDFEVNQIVRQMPCKHIFHSDCILPWLQSHQTCPVCRHHLN